MSLVNRRIRLLAVASLLFAPALAVSLPASSVGPAREDLKLQYDPIIRSHALKYKVPAELIHSIIKAESNYDYRAVSPKGAAGLMQLMPETAAQYGVEDRFDPEDNIMGGVKYLKDLIKLYNNNTKMVLAAYNAGQEALKKFNGIPPYAETRQYIRRVMADYPKTYIGGLPVRKFTTPDGKRVFTNDPFYHLNHKVNKD
jgi:soluble lytic murein transglycosylase-like protein